MTHSAGFPALSRNSLLPRPSLTARTALAALAGLLLTCGLALAATTTSTATTGSVNTKETALQRIQRMVARIDAEASTPEGEEAVVARLSKQLGVSAESLQVQHANWALGYGEISMVYGFARASKKPVTPDQVVEMRRSGLDWEALGKSLGVKVDTVASKMKKNVGPKPAPQPK